jgi:hypothetical protein
MPSQGLSDLLAMAITLSCKPKTSAEIRALIRHRASVGFFMSNAS